MSPPALQVLVADDHALIRQGLVGLLRAAEPGWSFREAGSLPDLRALQQEAPADLIVLDLRMPGMEGGESLRGLRTDWPATLVVVLTGIDERESILECLGAGVHGYVLKTTPTAQILQVLHSVLAGALYVPPELARAAEPVRPPAPIAAPVVQPAAAAAGLDETAGTLHGFTGRQQEVLHLLAEGRSTKEIARSLNLGVGTVKVHLSAIYRILGAHNRMEAVVRAGALRG